MDNALKEALLRNLSKQDIIDLFDLEPEQKVPEKTKADYMTARQKVYLKYSIPGTTSKCNSCGRDTVTEEQAIELLGGDNN